MLLSFTLTLEFVHFRNSSFGFVAFYCRSPCDGKYSDPIDEDAEGRVCSVLAVSLPTGTCWPAAVRRTTQTQVCPGHKPTSSKQE